MFSILSADFPKNVSSRHLRQTMFGLLTLFAVISISACSSNPTPVKQQFDLGPVVAAQIKQVTPAPASLRFVLADIQASTALDSQAMLYRLQYDNAQQLKAYAYARWSMPPAQLIQQRIKQQVSAAGGLVLQRNQASADIPLLQLELDEFSQVFSSVSNSHVQLNMRALMSKAGKVLRHRQFQIQLPAGNDAAAGAHAMQQAVDQLILELQQDILQLN
ncbi:membrane integrity-associated transporter subunit PqiC [Undibacterium sp. CY7W]|uniref:Membrane integrity-associated transporter subunit PqiC n=2 Tax=Undibacterium TaxID=401469 RepID=A0A923I624_9BURK|nr:ABC-type transport auxiliary lipoprotein family protein [Undibacterium rugosum]MBC3937015.1 membrane integrity-associated transporter subunit PqiC [Undibacterium rugosum]